MKRFYIYIIMCIVVSGFCSCGGDKKMPTQDTEKAKVDTMPMLITEIQQCSRLYTAEYQVHKIVTHDDEVRLKGTFLKHQYDIPLPTGSRKVAIPIDATIKAYIDFTGFSEKNVKRNGNKITVVLPDPKMVLTSSRVNHNDIKKYVATLRSNFSDAELSDYENQGRAAILADIPKMGIAETSKQNAAKILVPILVSLGFNEKDITIQFRKDFTTEDIRKMIDPTVTIEGK